MKKPPISLLCGIAAIIVTVILYFIILGNIFLEIICFMTLIGVVVAEAITTVFAYLSKGKPRRMAAATVSALMIPFAIVLSVVYIIHFPHGYRTYLCWYFAALIIVYVIAFVLYHFDSQKESENNNLQSAKENIVNMRKIVKCIMVESSAEPYTEDLNKIEDALHFSNDNIITPEDETIYNMLVELQLNISNPDFDCKSLIAKIEKSISIRNIMSKKNV